MKNSIRVIAVAVVLSCSSCATLIDTPQERQTRLQLSSIIVPEIEFRGASIHDVVAFLNGSLIGGINQVYPQIVLLLPHGKTTDLVDLQMRQAPVLDILEAVARLTDSKFYIHGTNAFLEPRHPRLKPIVEPDTEQRKK